MQLTQRLGVRAILCSACILGIAALIIASGCDTTAPPPPEDHGSPLTGQPPQALAQGLPPLEQLSSHTASYIEPVTKPGIDTVLHYGNVNYGAAAVMLLSPVP